MWNSHIAMAARAAPELDFAGCTFFSTVQVGEDPELLDRALLAMESMDLVVLYRSGEQFWGHSEERLRAVSQMRPLICMSHDPSYWSLSSVKPQVAAKANAYLVNGGPVNFSNMLRYLCREACGVKVDVAPPRRLAWEGIYHPDAPDSFGTFAEYVAWRGELVAKRTVGLLFTRNAWVNGDLDVENGVIRELEAQGMGVVPVFSYSTGSEELGSRGSLWSVREFFLDENGSPRIGALIRLNSFLLSSSQRRQTAVEEPCAAAVALLKELDVPVFCPLTTTSESVKQWRDSTQGFTGRLVGWAVAMPEFEGVIEPIMAGAGVDEDAEGGTVRTKAPVDDRVRLLVRRVKNWIRLRSKPPCERKVAFILHNNPCASVEATVGGAAKLDSLESVARILQAMQNCGYGVNAPADGKELIETIMSRKAVSEFRWTTVNEIVEKGGALALVTKEEYCKWFDTLSEKVRNRMTDAWGSPPGEEKDGVAAAMVHDGKIVVTGVNFGNAVVCAQPKRGCAGARCDGRACKILHDPDIPPTHQYIATYRYLEECFGADVIVHVGTHGNLEFLPGKSTGLSRDCFPDIALGSMPHLYIYNSDNPPEGVIAKRRSNAVLVDHMQTVMRASGLYDKLGELDDLLSEYGRVKGQDPTRDHLLAHRITDEIFAARLEHQITVTIEHADGSQAVSRFADIPPDTIHDIPFEKIVSAAHGVLSTLRNSYIQDGMHLFGSPPQGESRAQFIASILRYDADGSFSLRKSIANALGIDYQALLDDRGGFNETLQASNGTLVERVDSLCVSFISAVIAGETDEAKLARSIIGDDLRDGNACHALSQTAERIRDIDRRITQSDETGALLHGFDGGYIPPGPSGLIMRGRDDVLPTGRNFYTLDPARVPTKTAHDVGVRLAEAVIRKHREEQGRTPENVAIYWMSNDIMWADGEGMAQIMHLIGVRPLWQPNGRLRGFEVISHEELGRERIDVTIRVSGITRDNFSGCIDIIDDAIRTVAALPEPPEINFVRKHVLERLSSTGRDMNDKAAFRDATFRIFASRPGTYSAGTQLAVYASAWKEEKDLCDIFVYWNGYAYGNGAFGLEKHGELADALRSVDITYNKVVSDESDLFGCCSYFGAQGGMTAAARHLSGRAVKTYYGDTREPQAVEVRDMADEIRRVVRSKLLNPRWIEGQKRHGYKGAGDISKRIGRIYGWEATTREVDDEIFDDVARTFVLDRQNRSFFRENNPWALEEISRRLLEASQRGLWKSDPELLDRLKNSYIEIESWLEEDMGDTSGDFQGGSVDVVTADEVENWSEKMEQIRNKLYK